MTSLRIISWNVNGIRASVKKGFYEKIKEMNPDILCIQETKAQNDVVETIAAEMNDYQWYANSAVKKGYSGTAIFSKTPPIAVTNDINKEEHDQEGRVIAAEYEQFFLVNVYVPNSGQGLKRLDYRKEWDADFLNYLKQLQDQKPLILTGDLNVAHEPIDLARPQPNYNKTAGYTQIEIDGFDNMVSGGLIDSFRHLHPEEIAYTFWNQRFNARERNVGWRIDYFMVSQPFMEKVNDSIVLDEVYGSDHCPVELVLDL